MQRTAQLLHGNVQTLRPGVIFAVNSSSMLTGKIFSWKIRHDIKTFCGCKPYKKNIEPYQNFTGLYEKGVGALNKLQNP